MEVLALIRVLDGLGGQNDVGFGDLMKVLRCDELGVFGGKTYDRVVLFDRDGILNVDHGYVFEREKFEWIEGAERIIQAVAERGFGVGVVTNQSGIGRGYYSEAQFLELMDWVGGVVPIDLVVYCPHAPEAGCPGRKPGTRMVEMSLEFFGCDTEGAVLVGDKVTDIEAAQGVGVRAARFGGDLFNFVQELL